MDESIRLSEGNIQNSTLRGGRRDNKDRFSGYFKSNLSLSKKLESSEFEELSIPGENELEDVPVISKPRESACALRLDLDPRDLTPNKRDSEQDEDMTRIDEQLREGQENLRSIIQNSNVQMEEIRELFSEFRASESRNIPRRAPTIRSIGNMRTSSRNPIENYARDTDFLYGKSSLESGYRGGLRIVSNFIFLGMMIMRCYNMKKDARETKDADLLKAMVIKEDDYGIPYGGIFRFYAVFKMVEYIFSIYDFIHFKRIKKKIYKINYSHFLHSLAFYIMCIIFLRNTIKFIWLLTLVDSFFQIVEIAIFCNNSGKMEKSYININIICTWVMLPARMLVCLKLDGIIVSWSVALIPFYLVSTIILIFGIVLFAIKKHAYSDFWGNFHFFLKEIFC